MASINSVFVVIVQRHDQANTDEGYVRTVKINQSSAEKAADDYNKNPTIANTHAIVIESDFGN